jgi:hypothetical protein
VFFSGDDGYGGPQQAISIIFVLVAFITVPTMLLVKPLILKRRLEHHAQEHVEVSSSKIDYANQKSTGNDQYDQIR